MPEEKIAPWQHDHVFGQDRKKAGEQRTLLVVLLTAAMMVVEVVAGISFGSMALLADGLHMASHTAALGISLFAYVYARKHAASEGFSLGTGKISCLAGFGSAVLLAGFALIMVTESTGRMINPVPIEFDQAIVVAVVGLVVNGLSAWLLIGTPHDHGHEHGHGPGDAMAHDEVHLHHDHRKDHGHGEHHHDQVHAADQTDHRGHDAHDTAQGHGHDHNLRAAYLHVLADALTSVLAIVALLAGKYFGAAWLDPAMGIVGAALIARWSWGLLLQAGRVLLDFQADESVLRKIRDAIQGSSGDRVADLHVWSIGHGIYAASITVVSAAPGTPEYYRSLLPASLSIVHSTVEVHEGRSAYQ